MNHVSFLHRIFFAALLFNGLLARTDAVAAPTESRDYEIIVLPRPEAQNYTPRKIVEAVNAPVQQRTVEQATLVASLGNPIRAAMMMSRPPTDYEVEAIQRANRNGAYSNAAQQFGYVSLTYTAPKNDANKKVATTAPTTARLRASSEFLSVEESVDGAFTALPIESEGYLGNGAPPLDTSSVQWGMHAMRFPQAWEKVRGHAHVAVVDSGVDIGHPDLIGNLRPHFSFSSGSDSPGLPLDVLGHGTHVAGIIGATHNNQPNSVAGGCANCSLSVFGGIDPRMVARAADIGMQATNMSFTSVTAQACENQNAMMCAAIAKSVNRGVSIAASAGNSRKQQLGSPASVSGVMAIGGLQLDDGITTSFWDEGFVQTSDTTTQEFGSSWGDIVAGVPQVKLVAPAKNVLATFLRNRLYQSYARCGDSYGPPAEFSVGYGLCTGTSMSAPHVTAAAALVKSANPLLIGEEVQTLLTSTAAPIGGESLERQGYGVPRVDAAVQAVLDQGGAGKTNAVNRVTPLLGFFAKPMTTLFTSGPTPRAFDHFFTTVPQMGLSARIGTLLPAPQKITVNPIQGSGNWVSTCTGQCDPNSALSNVTLSGPISFVTSLGQTLNLHPVASLPSPYTIRLSADAYIRGTDFQAPADAPRREGQILPPFDGADLQTTLSLYGDFEWLIRASIRGVEFSTAFDSWGKAIPGYANLVASPNDPSVHAGDGSLANFEARGVAGVLTTHVSPFAAVPDSEVVPLYRLSWKCGAAGPQPMPEVCNPNSPTYLMNHVARAYATTDSARSQLVAQGFEFDGIEGYVFARSVAVAPPGTTRLCQRYNESTNDRVLFLETDSPQGCNATQPPFHPDSLNGKLDRYLVNTEQDNAGFLGYAFIDLTPRPIFEDTQSAFLSPTGVFAAQSFDVPLLPAGTAVRAHEATPGWEFIGEAGVQRGAFASAPTSPQLLQTAWIKNAGRIRTVVGLTPGEYVLTFKMLNPNQIVRVSFAGRVIGTITPSAAVATYLYYVNAQESGEYPLVFEGMVRQILRADADPGAMAFIDDVNVSSTNGLAACNLDVDGDNNVHSHSDGVAIMRLMQGLPSTAVAANVLSPSATVAATDVARRASAQARWLDIDGDGKIKASSDGRLLLRALLGFAGHAATEGALGANATRTSWPVIREYLRSQCGLRELAP